MKALSPEDKKLMDEIIKLTKEKDLLDLEYYASDLAAMQYHKIDLKIKALKKEMTKC